MAFASQLLLVGTVAASPNASTWGEYKRRFDLHYDDDARAFASFAADMRAAALGVTANMTCTQCYSIHGGAAGDCSSVFGCNHELCDFCTNEVSCSDCYKIHGGAKGDCCEVMGCDNNLCDFCTNPDSTTSCPPPSPPKPPPPSSCPGGTLRACIGLCPHDQPTVYVPCVDNCLSKCP